MTLYKSKHVGGIMTFSSLHNGMDPLKLTFRQNLLYLYAFVCISLMMTLQR
jgi:hypothetical protein